MKPTIYDVAKKAEVSTATVSKVINKTGSISDKTKKKVLDVMRELDYQPSGVAVALTGKSTYIFGVIVPDVSDPVFASVVRDLENSARESGYSIIICSTDDEKERERENIELLLKKQVDGIIMATEPNDWKHLEKLQNRNIPYILFTVDDPSYSASIVTTDDIKGGYLAGRYLLEHGHRQIGIIYESERLSGRNRMEGFKQSLADANIPINKSHIIESKPDIGDARLAAKKLLTMKNMPTAVFVTTELGAAVLVNEARKLNLSVPNDLSVIGYDNTIHAKLTDPGLTTIAQPFEELSKYAIMKLVEFKEKPDIPDFRILLAPMLVERNSVKKIQSQGEY